MSKDKINNIDKINEFHATLQLERNFFNLKSPVCLLCAVKNVYKGYHDVPRDEHNKIEKESIDNS